MTFGQTMKLILKTTGISASFLADKLGYDGSYISRWISGQKLPSLKNNDDLFQKIASVVNQNCSDAERDALAGELIPNAQAGLAGKQFELELSRVLSNAFYSSGPSFPSNQLLSTGENGNANLAVLPAKTVYQVFYDALEYASKVGSDSVVNVIVNGPLHFYANEEFSMIQNVPENRGITKQVVMHQTVNMDDFRKHLDLYCARFCQFFSNPSAVKYQLYRTDDRPETDNLFIVIEDSLLYFYLQNPFSGQTYSLVSGNRDLVFEYYTSTEANLSLRQKLVTYCDLTAIHERKLIYRSLMAGKLELLLHDMVPLCMEEEMFSSLCDKAAADISPEVRAGLKSQYIKLWQAEKSVIIFKSAIVSYICDGKLELFGKTVCVDEKSRREHLTNLISRLKGSARPFCILSDDNPLLNYNECGVSVYLSDGIAFAESFHESNGLEFIRIRSLDVIECFYDFFDHIKKLDNRFLLTGDQAIDFIERGMEMI